MWLRNLRQRDDAERLARLEWTCHVCGERRPDAKISVFKSTQVRDGVTWNANVRYCNDRVSCVEGAKDVLWLA